MDKEKFFELARKYKIVPLFEVIPADLLTPVLAFYKIRKEGSYNFLLESVEGIGRFARYSIIGTDPHELVTFKGNKIEIAYDHSKTVIEKSIFEFLKNKIKEFNYPLIDELPQFSGGYIGYFGYETISSIEKVIRFNQEEQLNAPDAFLGLFNKLLIFDHYQHQIVIVNNILINKDSDLEIQFNKARSEIKEIKKKIVSNKINIKKFNFAKDISGFEKEKFLEDVNLCKKDILNGEVFQIVLSRRFSTSYEGDLFNVYRALRIINPSPYMYFLEYPENLSIIGTSPEDLLKVQNKKATILPIAGTRKRGKTEQEDLEMENELLNDPKEIAEHMMLIDLARNDLGRVCEFDSIKLSSLKKIERFSHVMHIVSRVEGILKKEHDAIDALKASFPAGTVTGAPKIRAIQLLSKYETIKRNIYAGAIGYIDFRGNLDLCIAIRTLFANNKKIYWQSGAGIVADSVPELEYKEIYNKSAAMVKSLEFAEELNENSND